MREKMFEVEWMGISGVEKSLRFPSLDSAMTFSRTLNRFVTIKGNGMEIVGKMGVDSIINGKCPDGVDYTWMKRRSQ